MERDLGLTGVERQEAILRRLGDQQRILVPEICEAFAVSEVALKSRDAADRRVPVKLR